MKNEVITIDLGSNSFRVLKYDYLNFKIIDEYHQVTGLADGLIDSGIISFEALNRVVEALCIAKDKLNFNPNNAVCVTTAAMRKAKNSNEALEYIVKNSGAKFKIIDAEEEARLTLLAIKYALKREKIDTQNFTLLDIGGGSTELTISFEDKIYTKSFDFGIVTMTQKALKDGKLFEDLRNQEIVIKEFLATLDFSIKDFPFIATAGTPTTIASIKLGYSYFNYDKNVVNGTILDIEDLENSLKLLKEKSLEELVALVGKGRVEYLEIGTYIYKLFFNVLEKSKSIVLDDGLREGVAIDYALSLK
ncbi:exopolyphosphatase [Aliarcobacter trophiarum LMG 25534]|uniref:Exopolyphosphatase n=1 Tax=Aliarcobacter trophiarum LMG 25534 TaxID=1032241 RepID=A0AAD0VM56_9BACT|nr:exopolyphosphatase [Aliarcobacter trophiarum]AXK48859.1 exopolyphosphatase, Ppx/GppA family [Aliarcobacter trophiarum LMG 25534]RXJ92595.1 exopolyphosphatase [Aliarcobacter trophiarum LMG 25534]